MSYTEQQVTRLAEIVHGMRNRLREASGQEPFPAFKDAEQWMQESAVTSMRNALEHPEVTPEVEHERWYQERWDQGWRWGEHRDNERKLNPAMVHYDDLPVLEKMKDELGLAVAEAVRVVS